jgi:hypothetical protein
MLLNCVISYLYMRVLKIFLGNIFLLFFLCFQFFFFFFCVKRQDGGSFYLDGAAGLPGCS